MPQIVNVLAFGQHLFVRSEKLCKVTQTSAECKTKNEVFGFAYAECSQTYLKLRKKNEQIVNSGLLICSLLMVLTPKYTDNLGL